MQHLVKILLPFLLFITCGTDKPWLDLNKNDVLDDYENPSLSVDERVKDLVRRMSLDEKISQLQGFSKPIERLGINAYVWRNEA